MYSHLTNTSINKFSPWISFDKNEVGPGCKWKFEKLSEYLLTKSIDFEIIMNRIKTQVLLTLVGMTNEIPRHPQGVFELYGFGNFEVNFTDFLIDENLKTWILEVNLSPALSVDCEVDAQVKKVH